MFKKTGKRVCKANKIFVANFNVEVSRELKTVQIRICFGTYTYTQAKTSKSLCAFFLLICTLHMFLNAIKFKIRLFSETMTILCSLCLKLLSVSRFVSNQSNYFFLCLLKVAFRCFNF